MSIALGIALCILAVGFVIAGCMKLYYNNRCLHDYEKQGEDTYQATDADGLGKEDYVVRTYLCKKCGKTKKIRT